MDNLQDTSEIDSIGGNDPYHHWISLSLDRTPLQDQHVFYIGAEGGTLNLVAYLVPFTTTQGIEKDRLETALEFNGTETLSLSNYTCTRRSDKAIVYSFTIERNTSGKQLGCGACLKDTSGLPDYESLDRFFYVFQAAE